MRLTGPDFYFDSNNGTVALHVNPLGRLCLMAAFYRTTFQRGEKEQPWEQPLVWVFKPSDHDDPELKDLTVGNLDNWHAFKAACERLGLTFRQGGCYVPLSNGCRETGEKDEEGNHIWSWKWDSNTVRDPRTLPGPEKLAQIVKIMET